MRSKRGGHRDLHSFPTRRSSDLATRADHLRQDAVDGVRMDEGDLETEHAVPRRLVDQLGARLRKMREGRGTADRKSTRLNSSHRCISYAVFCLKKKKN